MCNKKLVFIGIIASSSSLKHLSITDGYLAVEEGKIVKKGPKEEFIKLQTTGLFSDYEVIQLDDGQFLMPGLVDCHTHAPQFPNIGLGLDLPLLKWLEKYTFPLESQYANVDFAAAVYDEVVRRLLKNGTTTACYFGSLHLGGTLELVKSAIKHHQRALVGKVSMNIKNDAGYYNDTEKEVEEVENFVKKVLSYKNDLVTPVITPRFAVSCDEELMTKLAKLSQKYDCMIQSHISENASEIELVLKINPGCKSYGEVYDKSQILNSKCIMAHAVHPRDDEITLLSARGVSVAHCPASNTRLRSGLCPVRKFLDNNVTVGLGTDVAGGDSSSILDTMRRAMDVSMHLQLQGAKSSALEWQEVFYLATMGGAKALNLDNKIGSLEVGKDFDALLVDVYALDGPIDRYRHSVAAACENKAAGLVQKFVHLADDRNILHVYVQGKRVKEVL